MQNDFEKLLDFVLSNRPLFVLTGAGCSTASGIPDYRDRNGAWKFSKPVQLNEFLGCEKVRKRYWARSMIGWPRIYNARPNTAHTSLATMEKTGIIHYLVTQNVDGLHQKAGSERVLDLHGNLEKVICIDCRHEIPRLRLQDYFAAGKISNKFNYEDIAPDGDVILNDVDYDSFIIPDCEQCKGILKPDVVFFGETVPKDRVSKAVTKLKESNGLLVIGSSLMVYSGYRFVRDALKNEIPVAAINLGKTRADSSLKLKYETSCGPLLKQLSGLLTADQKPMRRGVQAVTQC